MPDTLDWDLWLGIQEMRPYSPAYLPFAGADGWISAAARWATMACHILGAAEYGAAAGRSDERRVHSQQRARAITAYPKIIDHPVRLPCPRLHAAGQDLLVRRGAGSRHIGRHGLAARTGNPGRAASRRGGRAIGGRGAARQKQQAAPADSNAKLDAQVIGRPPDADRTGGLFVGDKGFITSGHLRRRDVAWCRRSG